MASKPKSEVVEKAVPTHKVGTVLPARLVVRFDGIEISVRGDYCLEAPGLYVIDGNEHLAV